eukprot:766530-Hanusia_phi.AAC.1
MIESAVARTREAAAAVCELDQKGQVMSETIPTGSHDVNYKMLRLSPPGGAAEVSVSQCEMIIMVDSLLQQISICLSFGDVKAALSCHCYREECRTECRTARTDFCAAPRARTSRKESICWEDAQV